MVGVGNPLKLNAKYDSPPNLKRTKQNVNPSEGSILLVEPHSHFFPCLCVLNPLRNFPSEHLIAFTSTTHSPEQFIFAAASFYQISPKCCSCHSFTPSIKMTSYGSSTWVPAHSGDSDGVPCSWLQFVHALTVMGIWAVK